MVGAALAGALVGLLGVDGGILWLVGGVWVVRRAWGRPPGIAWGITCLVAGMRWGTLGVGGVEAATRLVGPTLVSGRPVLLAGVGLAVAAALAEEAADDGLRAESVPERAASAIALAALVPLFAAPGWGATAPLAVDGAQAWVVSAGWWIGAGALVGGAVLLGARWASRLPWWVPPTVAGVGAIAVGAGR